MRKVAGAVFVTTSFIVLALTFGTEAGQPAPEPTPVLATTTVEATIAPEPMPRHRLARKEPTPMSEPTYRAPRTTKRQGVWSEAQVKAALYAGCEKYGITGSDRSWLVAAGLRIAWAESRYNPSARNANSSAAGLFQFLAPWGSLEARLDPVWSCNRFCRVYRDGGEAAIRRHWAATI